MPRPVAAALLLLLGVVAAATAQTPLQSPGGREQADFQLQLERRLLVLDLAAYDEARTREQQARGRFDEVSTRLDQTLRGDSLTLGALESLRDELDAAREATRTASSRVDEQVRRLIERLHRIGFLEGEVGGARPPARTDAITGEWRVRIQPGDQSGVFVLALAGSVVTGTYRLANGDSGSLRGALTGNALRLERVDARRGFDSVFEGTVTADGQMSGLWTANELAAGAPARGGWSAVRLRTASPPA